MVQMNIERMFVLMNAIYWLKNKSNIILQTRQQNQEQRTKILEGIKNRKEYEILGKEKRTKDIKSVKPSIIFPEE